MPPPAPPADPLGGEATAGEWVGAFRDLLASGLAEARARWGPIDLPFERFAPRAVGLAAVRLERVGVARTATSVRDALTRTALPDLALAIACSEGRRGSWEALVAGLSPRLRGLARKHGASEEEARTLADDVLSEMSLPAPAPPPRARIAGYEGAGSLFGWAAVILIRRRARIRGREAARGTDTGDATPASVGPPDPRAPDPLDALARADALHRLEGALDRGWAALPARERLALASRYLDGRPQTEIARLLRVSEPHTSRILSAALARFREVVRGVVGEEAAEFPGGWPAVVDAVRRSRVFAGGETPLPDESPPRSKGPR